MEMYNYLCFFDLYTKANERTVSNGETNLGMW